MPGPRPLIQCESPKLDWSREKTPAAFDFNDIYFSVDGGIEESRTVFLGGCGLPKAWKNTPHYTIAELGFGTGVNFLTCCKMWSERKQAQSQTPNRLDYVSIEKYPFSKDQLKRALSHFPDLQPYSDRLIDIWPGPVRGIHRIELTNTLTLTLIHDDVLPALSSIDHTMDAWFLDGFSPERNPDMWSQTVMDAVALRSKKGTRIASFTVAGSVRSALSEAGFTVFKKEGFGRKRNRLEAIFEQAPKTETLKRPPKNPLIIGGGIAGAAVCRAFLRIDIRPTLIEKSDTLKTAASGNAAAIIKPRLDLQDRPESRFFLASFLYAQQAYRESGHVLQKGIMHLAKDKKEKRRFEKIVSQAPLGYNHLRLTDEGLSLPSALIIDPKSTLEHWTRDAKKLTANVTRIEKCGSTYTVFNSSGDILASGDAIILCAGADIPYFEIKGLEDLRFSRGQLSWARVESPLNVPITYGGYAIPLGENTLIGATHARLNAQDPFIVTKEDDQNNLEAFTNATGKTAKLGQGISRASIRVTTPNTLPRVDEIDENYWVMTGLGSRGFVFAPLLGAHIVSQTLGSVSPLSTHQEKIFKIKKDPIKAVGSTP